MQILFILIRLFGLFYFLLKNRIFDFFSVAYFSACIYFLPGFFGYALEPLYLGKSILINETYIVMILVLISIMFFTVIYDFLPGEKELTPSIYINDNLLL